MQVRFATPPVIDSPLARLDARWRLVGLLVPLIAVACLRTWWAALAGLAFSVVLAVLARMEWRWYLSRLVVIGGLVALFVVPVPLLSGSDGWHFAATLLIKALALFTLSSILVVTAPLETTLKAAHALYLPGLLVHLVLLSYRYLFLLADELARLRIALRVRGFRNRPNAHSYRTVAAASGTLLVRGYERGDRIAHAMRCRGFDGRFRSLTEFHTSVRDVAFAVAQVGVAVGLVVLDHIPGS